MSLCKQLVAGLLACTIFSSCTAFTYADDSPAGEVLEIAGITALETCDVIVMNEMVGRCGAYTATGAKGIAFEIIEDGSLNLKSLFSEEFTHLAYSPNATRADLVTQGANGYNTAYYQCKTAESASGIREIYNAVESGQYRGTNLVGTTECAEKYNTYAASKGSAKMMKDTGIPAEDCERIGKKFTNTLSASDALSHAGKVGLYAAAIASVVTLVNCIIENDSFEETFGEVTISAIKYGTVGTATTFIVDLAEVGLAAAGIGGATLVITSIVGTAAVSYLACTLVDEIIDETNFKEKVTEFAENAKNIAVELGEKIADAAKEGYYLVLEAGGNVWEKVYHFAVTTGASIAAKASEIAQNVKEKAPEKCEKNTNSDGGIFKGIGTWIGAKFAKKN